MGIGILSGNDTNRTYIAYKLRKKKKRTSNSSCLIKCSELSASIVTSIISFNDIDCIIGYCQHPSCL